MPPGGPEIREQYATTPDGWSLHLRRAWSPRFFDPDTKPLLIVPGYGMNSFIFSFHPRGTSMERCLAEGGFEVWSVDLRGQGRSVPQRRSRWRGADGPASLRNYAAIDMPAAIDRVVAGTKTRADRLVLIGCSLGGSIAYGHLALCKDHRVAELITMGAPLRWAEIHPALRVAFSSPRLARALRIQNTRELLRGALPVLLRVPSLLSLYMNSASIDTSRMQEMTETVEDPDPAVNQDIARWIGARDLELDGINVTDEMRRQKIPLLVVLPNRDGIVPERTALTIVDAWGGNDVEILKVGDDANWYAHANLFISDDAPDKVFAPIMQWLRRPREVR